MLFHSGKTEVWKNTNLDIKIGNSSILKVENFKYLGFTIDSNLNWSDHIEAVKTKLSKTIGILYKTRYFLNQIPFTTSDESCKIWFVVLG